jgi:hypothetical protein
MEAGLIDGRNSRVGQSTDVAGILAEVKLTCSSKPSNTLAVATLQTYNRFRDEGR